MHMMSFDFTRVGAGGADVSVDKKTQMGPRSELKPREFYFWEFRLLPLQLLVVDILRLMYEPH